MAQSINPFERKKQPVAAAVNPSKQTELLARASGRTLPGAVPQSRKPSVLETPPPAQTIPGITGRPPLPTGQVVGHTALSSMTDAERDTLEAAGWTPDIELPTSAEGLKQLQEAVATQMSRVADLPHDPRLTPEFKTKVVNIESLSQEEQAKFTSKIRESIDAIKQQETAVKTKDRTLQDNIARESTIKGSASAMSAAEQAIKVFQERIADSVELDSEEPAQRRPEPEKPQPQQKANTHTETGAEHISLTHCPHCQWDLAITEVAEPAYADKMMFLHCMIGDKPYSKEIKLFGGAVLVVLRTLTTKEIDIVYQQAFKDRQDGQIPNELDYWERLNRYRLILQLQSFRSEGANGFTRDLPDGYSASTNPLATGFWVTPEQEAELAPAQTGLPDIQAYILDEVLKTEAVFRVVNIACSQFNRAVSRLEAMADNTDFWKPIEEPS